MTPAQIFALTSGESDVNRRSEEESKKPKSQDVKRITAAGQSNLSKIFG